MPQNTIGSQCQLSAKELTLLDEQMNQEAIACKKCETYSQRFADPQLKTFSSQLAEHHRQRFESLLKYLNSNQ